ncbi:hypothetical protein MMC25_001401 [Agyrium rufum]|nr:hypothetical protein [Agyrium rufum]
MADQAGGQAFDFNDNNTKILRALELVNDPRTPNDVRQDASQFLEVIRTQDEAPQHGYVLAANKSYPNVARHYGLLLLEYAIKYRWSDYNEAQSAALREWICKLAQSVVSDDAFFIRNKIAQLWVELAKRSWALDWVNMDELLVALWNGSPSQKQLVLSVLENLSEDCFSKESNTSDPRLGALSRACVETFIPLSILHTRFPQRGSQYANLRYGEEGWVQRIVQFLAQCNGQDTTDSQVKACSIASLSTLRSVTGQIQMAAVDALFTVYNRHGFREEDVEHILRPMFTSEAVQLLRSAFASLIEDVSDLDQDRYNALKKFTELVHNIGRSLLDFSSLRSEGSDLSHFFEFLLIILRHDSLHVTIPVLHIWAKLLGNNRIANSPAGVNLIGPLLEICSQRMLRYEALPEDSDNPTIVYLNEDVDTMPERHAFLGNYTRFCSEIVQSIVAKRPSEAIQHILAQANTVLSSVYDERSSYDAQNHTKMSFAALRVDASLSVVEAALKGFTRKLSRDGRLRPENIDEVVEVELENWCLQMMGLTFEDPQIEHRIVQLVGEFCTRLRHRPTFTKAAFDFFTIVRLKKLPGAQAHNESVKELQAFHVHQLQRLAMRSSEDLLNMYDYVETRITNLSQDPDLSASDRYRCQAILFALIQRAESVDEVEREQRLQGFLSSVVTQWQDERFASSLSSFEGFCDLLGMASLQPYLVARNVQTISDWYEQPLDDEGKALQTQLQSSVDQLPLLSLKAFLGVSVEKGTFGSTAHRIACSLWSKVLPIVLEKLLQMISFAHAFHDPTKWTSLPPEMKSVVPRILTDRFWQVGISTGSRDEFYAKIGSSRSSLEGLASSIRASVRMVRETGYRLLSYMTLLDDELFKHPEVAEPIAKSLFNDSKSLSIHQTSTLVDLLPALILHCPAHCRNHFLPPILASMFSELDRKVSTEWENIEQRKQIAAANDDLVEEMRDESILRQLTFTSVLMVVDFMDPNRGEEILPQNGNSQQNQPKDPSSGGQLRQFIMQTPEALKPLILFCTHAIRMRDTRSCGMITRVIRSLIPEFKGESPLDNDVREFLSAEVLKACITSIHDPYFVDAQSDLAALVVAIIVHFNTRSATPRQILESLPDIGAEKVNGLMSDIDECRGNERQQKAAVLRFLEGLRGVSIGEQGRLPRGIPRQARSALQEQYMSTDPNASRANREEGSPGLGGVSNMFG